MCSSMIKETFYNTNDNFDYASRIGSTIDKLCSFIQNKKTAEIILHKEKLRIFA